MVQLCIWELAHAPVLSSWNSGKQKQDIKVYSPYPFFRMRVPIYLHAAAPGNGIQHSISDGSIRHVRFYIHNGYKV